MCNNPTATNVILMVVVPLSHPFLKPLMMSYPQVLQQVIAQNVFVMPGRILFMRKECVEKLNKGKDYA